MENAAVPENASGRPRGGGYARVASSAQRPEFEAIHPFADGNGRTGRLINTVYLAEQKLTDLPILCHSRYILRHRQEYYRLLQHTRKTNDWEHWIVWMLDGVRDTAEWIVKTLHQQAAMAQDTVEQYAEEQTRSPVRTEPTPPGAHEPCDNRSDSHTSTAMRGSTPRVPVGTPARGTPAAAGAGDRSSPRSPWR